MKDFNACPICDQKLINDLTLIAESCHNHITASGHSKWRRELFEIIKGHVKLNGGTRIDHCFDCQLYKKTSGIEVHFSRHFDDSNLIYWKFDLSNQQCLTCYYAFYNGAEDNDVQINLPLNTAFNTPLVSLEKLKNFL